MRIIKLGLLGFTGLTMIAFAPQASATDLTTATSAAAIALPITIVQTTGLDFATISRDASGDTITLTSGGGISGTGASTFSGTAAAALFNVDGDASTAVTISFSTGDTLTGPGTAMNLDNFTHDAGGSPAFDGTGDLQLSVGADLTIGAAQTAGAYSGTYTVTVDY